MSAPGRTRRSAPTRGGYETASLVSHDPESTLRIALGPGSAHHALIRAEIFQLTVDHIPDGTAGGSFAFKKKEGAEVKPNANKQRKKPGKALWLSASFNFHLLLKTLVPYGESPMNLE